VRDNLPKHAQEIYQAAYNSAWEEYNHDEERAHRVAWAAVKRSYEKDERDGEWRKRSDGNN
jgi:cation transport regulator